MILRFCLRIGDAGERREELAARVDVDHAARRGCCANVSITCSASFRRSRPWSTNTQVSRSPIARWISAAATDESTPPDSPSSTSSSPTCARIAATASPHVVVHVPVVAAAADVVREAREDRRALLRVRDFGMELHARRSGATRRPSPRSRTRSTSRSAVKPGGSAVTLSPWLIHTSSRPWPSALRAVLDVAEQRRVPARAHLGIAELAHRARSRRVPPSCAAIVCMP